ncbi:MAG: protease SohB [Pseudohongiellaceae bacterium]|nr:protease SohB [Pseudohongiellaceae bacterium]
MEFLFEYLMFLAKAVTIVVAIMIVFGSLFALGNKGKNNTGKGHLNIVRLNDELDDMRDDIKKAVLDKAQWKLALKLEKKRSKEEEKERKQQAKSTNEDPDKGTKKRVFVLDFDGDVAANQVESLREEVTAVLSLAQASDEIMLRLESPGGMVHAYGLASSQLERIKSAGVPLTICVDKVAASGGYMMACLADRLVAAPFAILGSIGVLVQLPNFNRLLRKNEIDYETITAGEYKSTLSTFGEITQKGKEKVKEDVEEMHVLFKGWVKDHRPSVDIDKIATGETWVGIQAIERNMIDEIMTSDDYIVKACDDADVFEVSYEIKQSLSEKIGVSVHKCLDATLYSCLRRVRESRFFS